MNDRGMSRRHFLGVNISSVLDHYSSFATVLRDALVLRGYLEDAAVRGR